MADQNQKTVAVEGKTYTRDQMVSGKVEIGEGSFIVGVSDDGKAAVLARLKSELNWEPKMAFSDLMPMFCGTLNQDKLIWLLDQEEVKYIEADGVVYACAK
eukprot:TRINITY_DN28540_c0_g1_i1.p1 TRINITY_DN28540_c0_g1~~TRINITY_DN28540_c0_g1_i1.p1  ORF type:complete len:101 (+),score=21.86 TRINITY_DN28540_c0_g1_i1:127-429(+)